MKLTINTGNEPCAKFIGFGAEWDSASYLQPDDLYGYGYLEAVKQVFAAEGKSS